MKSKRILKPVCAMVLTTGLLTACGGNAQNQSAPSIDDKTPFEITIATQQVGEIPAKDNEIELAIEKNTNTKLDFQWIPSAAYEDKKNVMIASGELPKALRLTYTATSIANIQAGMFWEVGPYLKEFPNLAAVNSMYYDNIKVDGKVYGVPLFRDIGRAGLVIRKDWMDKLNLKSPVTLDDWYNVTKAIAQQDPDGNGQADTLGLYLDKSFAATASSSFMTRFAVAQGAPNKWGFINGKMTPDFMTPEYMDTLKAVRKMYSEKLINQDFTVTQTTDNDIKWNNGKLGLRVAVASTADGYRDLVIKTVNTAQVDVIPLTGPKGVRLPAETGNNGFYVIPKSSVKTEAELKRVLKFFNDLLNADNATLLTRGFEGKHFEKADGGKVKWKDLSAYQREVKPYRDMLPSFEVGSESKALPLELAPLAEKQWKIIAENTKSAIANPALTLNSPTYADKGAELDTMISDSQSKYIMGKVDEAGWQAEVDRWLKSGGSKIIDEYTAEYNKLNKK